MRLVVFGAPFVLAAACSSEPAPAFLAFGVVEGQFETGSTIGLWTQPGRTVKFGDGEASTIEFEIGFRIDPPLPATLDDDGIGVAMIGMLPGRATIAEGEIDPTQLQLIGLSTDTAVIYKTVPGNGPAWSTQFPVGYSCGVCNRGDSPATYTPADCTFVTIEPVVSDPCVWFAPSP
jgi:hypothetical protein